MTSAHGKAAKPARRSGQPRTSAVRMFAMTAPGLAGNLAAELAAFEAITVRDEGHDGRSDVVLFEVAQSACRSVLDLRLSEDVFVEIGRTLRAEGDRPNWIAGRIFRPDRMRRALATRGAVVRPARKRATYRLIVRVLQERSFLRTELRRELTRAVGREQPEWSGADPAELEIWVTEYQPGKLVAGLRLTDVRMRQHDGRVDERAGALRPVVAAAMVRQAGRPDGRMLDPCCGSGTILAEAVASGWQALGYDIDPTAIPIARRNAPAARIEQGDARRLPLPDNSISACVSNLPFGRQYGVDGSMDDWLKAVLSELARVTRPGGRAVLLAPSIPRSVVPATLACASRQPLRLLGTKTTLWVYERT